MQIRPVSTADLAGLADIDGTVESADYLHLLRTGEEMEIRWSIEQRPLREKLIESNALDEETRFTIRQIVGQIDEGMALCAEHEGSLAALLIARPDRDAGVLRILDIRVDYDFRRQGLGTVLLFQAIAAGRELGLRAIMARTRTNNVSAARFLLKAGFDLAGMDERHFSNHDLVKEAVALFWYASLD